MFFKKFFDFLTVPLYLSPIHTELESAERKSCLFALVVLLLLFIYISLVHNEGNIFFFFLPLSMSHIAYSGICMHEHTELFDTSSGIHTVTLTTPL